MAALLALALLPAVALAQGPYYFGCYTEVPSRALQAATTSNYTTMTVTECATFCSASDYFGLEYGGECYCGDVLTVGSFPTFSTGCSMPCAGEASELCGGPSRLSVYGFEDVPPAFTPYEHDEVESYEPRGCWTEGLGVRALGSVGTTSSLMTIDGCAQFCLSNGHEWFGLEYMNECWCGEALDATSVEAASGDCFMECAGNPADVCGGGDRLSVYQWV